MTTKMTNNELNSQLVTNWLDNNPDFLNEYLKKIQIQRRSSIMNDKSGSLLANLHTSFRSTNNNLDELNTSNINSSQSWCNTATSSGNRSHKKNSIFSLIGYNSTNLNVSFSEPNLPTESNSLLQISTIPSKRKNFKQLGSIIN